MISIRGARVHNLKNVSLDLPKNKLIVITGLSGSGKSSLAFDTIYAEGQRRYMESLSTYARQFLEMQDKPDVDEIIGLSPTIAIDQKSTSHNPRSTVGTVTEIYDYLRVLFARAGKPHCPICKSAVGEQTVEQIADAIYAMILKTSVLMLAPVIKKQKGEHKTALVAGQSAGFKRVRFDGLLMDIDEAVQMRKDKTKEHSIEFLVESFEKGAEVQREHMIQRLKVALEYGNSFVLLVDDELGDETLLSQSFMCPNCKISLPKPEPRLFSFNSPHGACQECTGLGVKLVLDPDLVIPNPRLTIAQGAIKPFTRISGNPAGIMKLLELVGKKYGFSINNPVEKFSKSKLDVLLNGTGDDEFDVGAGTQKFAGILLMLEQKYRETDSDYVRRELESYMISLPCPLCEGKRLRKEILSVTIAGMSISDVAAVPIEDSISIFSELYSAAAYASSGTAKHKAGAGRFANEKFSKIESQVIERASKEIIERLKHLDSVGLGYLMLDRSVLSLSGGESQRVRLATQLGTTLSGVIYILDEPSIGLHPRDNEKLIDSLIELRDLDNTVIVVEHDAAVMRAADHIVDVGPGAGEYGGEILAEGSPKDILKDKASITGQYLSGKKSIPCPAKYRKSGKNKLTIHNAKGNNLKDITVSIPLGSLVCFTGVSGSGKSSLVVDTLSRALSKHFFRAKTQPLEHEKIEGLENIDKVVAVDQSPIGRTPRSNPATYTSIFTLIRDIFAETPEASMRKFDAGKFSFNVKGGGRCETCAGDGMQRIEMQFMPDVYVECPDCHGKRYNAEALEIHYKGKNISDVLQMTVEEARRFFADHQLLYEKLSILHDVGLGYIKLGQSATTLSGGEAQRVKLATELSRRSTGKTLYILDEPTTGLHFDDILRLLTVLQQLVEKGNTVLIIEHNLDVIKCADWIIDMGPEGGVKGGNIVAQGSPRDLAKNKQSPTGVYLKELK